MKMDDVKRAKREKARANQEADGQVEPRIISSREFISAFVPPDISSTALRSAASFIR
jgi:hypothetical protein